MTDRTGLGPLEVAVLRAVAGLSEPGDAWVRCVDVLEVLERDGLGATYLYAVIQDLVVPWRLHLPLLAGQGDFGSPGTDFAADATYTEVRLSPIGRLALRAEDGGAGPLPLALIEGSVYRGGRVPPFAPRFVADTLTRLLPGPADPVSDAELDLLVGAPALPTRGVVDGDLPALLRGEPAEMRMSCRVELRERGEHRVLEITGFPLGADVDVIVQNIASRASFPRERRGGGTGLVADVQDRSSERVGTRIEVLLQQGVDPPAAEAWLGTIWPVSIDATWHLPAPMSTRLRSATRAIAEQPSGLRQLRALL